MTAPISAEVRRHASRIHRRRLTRAARGWLVLLLAGALSWVGLLALFLLLLRVAP